NDEASVKDVNSRPPSSQLSLQLPKGDDEDEDEEIPQDIEEIWFPGVHGDLGGGWDPSPGEKFPLSHGPLVWIVREAQKAGLQFDEDKLLSLSCIEDEFNDFGGPLLPARHAGSMSVPEVQITGAETPGRGRSPISEDLGFPQAVEKTAAQSAFRQALIDSATTSTLHDCLTFGGGLKTSQVLWWRLMEYLPFRRMDLQPDNSWKSISWPLPKGEVRDIPEAAWIHNSALRRMQSHNEYRPGNLIIGGGGRGVRKAAERYGTGSWEVLREEGDPVGEVIVRKQRQSEED
ncbi:hypothetical protein MMC13_003083, partial [Lambiella insularis]|nr:hypothetical protein [Lambiella insularis]